MFLQAVQTMVYESRDVSEISHLERACSRKNRAQLVSYVIGIVGKFEKPVKTRLGNCQNGPEGS